MVSDWILRVRALIDAQFALCVVFSVLLLAAGGWIGWATHVSPETIQEEETLILWESTGVYSHNATVTEPNSVFPIGTEFENRTTYLTRVAPTSRVTFTHMHTAPTTLDVELDTKLVLSSVDDGTVQWSEARDLGQKRATAVGPNQPVSHVATVNASEVLARLEQIQNDLGTIPGEIGVRIRTTITITGTLDDERVSVDHHRDIRLGFSGDTYQFVELGDESYAVERTERISVEQEYGALRRIAGPVLLTIGLVCMGGLLRYRDELELSDPEEAYLEFRDDRDEFDDWITRIHLSADVYDLPQARAMSLADLVNFAIDVNAGVIEDPDTGAYYVLHDGTLYTFTPPPTPK